MATKTQGAKTTPVATEMKVLAMIVRGDRHQDIAKEVGVHPITISDIKKRNSETLEIMRSKLADHRLSQATKILDKANKAIESKLDKYVSAESELDNIRRRFENGEIDLTEYRSQQSRFEKTTLTELVAVSREMHSQAKTEVDSVGKATNPQETQEKLVELVEAIKSGNEVEMQKIIFRPSS